MDDQSPGSAPSAPDIDRDRRLDEVARLVARARKALASGELAMSARPLLHGETGVYPQFVSRASGCRVIDAVGGVYVDWLVGWGSVLLGYARPEIEAAILRQLAAAAPTLSMASELEVEVAERLIELVPCAEMVAFAKNGSDAVTAAVRLARAHTERDHILHFGFHGFHDWFAATNRGIRGLPTSFDGLVHPFAYNDLDEVARHFDRLPGQVAAVVMEPFRHVLPEPGFLEGIRELTTRHGALLVFDEMVTGFRVSPGGGQALTGVVPDLACFGKALSNGMPLSALVGPRELMKAADFVGVDMTCRGETLSLASARAALELYADGTVAQQVAAIGRRVADGLREAASEQGIPLRIEGHPARLELSFDAIGPVSKEVVLGLFIQHCMDRGVILNGLILPTAAHDDDAVALTIRAAREAFGMIRRAAEGETASLPPPHGPSTIGFIDSVEKGDGAWLLRGWILPAGEPPQELELVDSSGQTATATFFVRPDVAAAHPAVAGAGLSGFELRLFVPAASPRTWTLRAQRGGRIVFRCRLVASRRSDRRRFPREVRDGQVLEI